MNVSLLVLRNERNSEIIQEMPIVRTRDDDKEKVSPSILTKFLCNTAFISWYC